MDKCLIDTDVLIWYLRGQNETVELVRKAADQFELAASVISRTEILIGMKEKERAATTALLESLTPYTITPAIADMAADLIRKGRRAGSTMAIPDALIAATVIDQELAFFTYNRKHFPIPAGHFYRG